MLKRIVLLALMSLFAAVAFAQAADSTAPAVAATTPAGDGGGGRKMQFGAGIHYMKTVGGMQDAPGWESDAANFLLAGKRPLGPITLELDSEWSLDFGGTDKTLWMPQAFGLIGGMIYAGAGIGSGYIDGEWFDNPFYTLRVGVILPLKVTRLDVNANYYFIDSSAFDSISSEDLDSVTFGAVLWF
jgi:hypothetical protein